MSNAPSILLGALVDPYELINDVVAAPAPVETIANALVKAVVANKTLRISTKPLPTPSRRAIHIVAYLIPLSTNKVGRENHTL
jgi:hypothetical protein